MVHKAHAKCAMDSKKVNFRDYGKSKLWQGYDYNNKKKAMRISWARDRGEFGNVVISGKFKVGSHVEDNCLNFSKISKTPIQRNKFSSRVMQELSWPPLSFDMAQEKEATSSAP